MPYKGNIRMKFPTLILCCAIWFIPGFLVSQNKGTVQSKIDKKGQSGTSFEHSKRQLDVSNKRESVLSLKVIRLRNEIAKVQGDQPQKDNMERLDIQLLTSKELALNLRLVSQREWTTLLKETIYWPKNEREQALLEWHANHMNDEVDHHTFPEKISNHLPEKIYAHPANSNNLMSFPPEPKCDTQQIEGQKGDWVVRTKPQLLFSHTDKKLESHFPLRDFITGYGNVASSPSGMKIFNLDILLASPKARQIFGVIPQKDLIVLVLLDGTKISLQNRVNANGYWDVNTQSYIYHGQYLIGAKEERLLMSNEVDRILIKWSKAKEVYEIFEMDFFINQLRCLENH